MGHHPHGVQNAAGVGLKLEIFNQHMEIEMEIVEMVKDKSMIIMEG